ncbi:3'-5' exonuclease [Altererythrobacter soli]|uniref:3'-5' exonuclease n=1 Tax=Croceibacterium soli TaxID=1739690 RepID=A0A6I4UT97_9SPHN|nr:3'-5' exonuclease [Croceibacterium soli]MXP41868.1 3'-5' exonuclease [Croceibacterium soli]
MTESRQEVFVSVDVETSGPIPGVYSMLSIGACLVDRPETTFTALLQPISDAFDMDALAVTGMSLEELRISGMTPDEAMTGFARWVEASAGPDATPVFVGFNAPFDWSFVNYYFHRFIGSNPFGFTALDIKALYMGATCCDWSNTRSSRIAAHLKPELKGDHDALHDALYQAELFRLIRQITTVVRV